jgi:hypothetical protein
MSYGFLALNDANQVLVSSETRNLHFIGKPALFETRISFNDYGGCRLFVFRVESTVPVVPFFTMVTFDFHGITAVRNVFGYTWEIEIVRSGTNNTPPECYVFADPRATTPTETYGMAVYREDGTPAFDSRMQPLAITGGATVVPPYNPRPTLPYGLDSQYCGSSDAASGGVFVPDQWNNFPLAQVPPFKAMYSYSSLAQSERESRYTSSREECDGVDLGKGGCAGAERRYDWSSTYWAFYRNGIRRNNNSIDAGWVTVAYGCNWTYEKDSAFIGIGTGGSSGSGGTWPYSNETLNLVQTPVIIADGARYD